MKIVLSEKAIMPERAHRTDAGLDLFTPTDFWIAPHGGRYTVLTGVRIRLPEGTYGDIRSKSGLMRDYGIIATGTVDEGYTGYIGVTLINTGNQKVEFHRGDKVAQLVIIPCERPDLEVVEWLPRTARGNNGYGSTGNKPREWRR